MSEHQSGAGGAPDRGPGMGSPGLGSPGTGGSPDAVAGGQDGQGRGAGYGAAQAGSFSGQGQGQGSAHALGQAPVPPPAAHPQTGQGEANWPPAGQSQLMSGGFAGMPPWLGQAPYPPPGPGAAPGLGYPGFAAAPHNWAPQYSAPHYSAPQYGAPPYGAPPYAVHPGAYAGYPPPHPGVYPPDAAQGMHQGHAYGAGQGAGAAHGARMSDLVEEAAGGGNGLATLSKMLNFDDPDFWKGALVGAAAVLLLTSESVQHAVFGSGGNGNGAGGKETSP